MSDSNAIPSAVFQPDPDRQRILETSRLLLSGAPCDLSVQVTPHLDGPIEVWSRHVEAVAAGPVETGFFEAWPRLEAHADVRVTIVLIPFAGGNTPDEALDLPGIVLGGVVYGIRARAHVTDEPGVSLEVAPIGGNRQLLAVFDEEKVALRRDLAPISPEEISAAREALAWRKKPSVRQIVARMTDLLG